MPENIEQELAAIKTIVEALHPLDAEARQRVFNYVTQNLDLQTRHLPAGPPASVASETETDVNHRRQAADIRSLREEKNPRTDVEMAVLVAYYLSETAPTTIRKDTIGTEDIHTYFKQAGHPLPSQPRFTLVNAKTAGYLESAGHGQYKLNPVGHNLIAHSMPRAEGDTCQGTRTFTKLVNPKSYELGFMNQYSCTPVGPRCLRPPALGTQG